MDLFKDLYYTNRYVLEKTSKLFLKNWIIVLAGFAYVFIKIVLYQVLGIISIGPLGLIASIILFIVNGALISNYLYLLYNIVNKEKVNLQDFKDGFSAFFRKVITIIIIGNLISWIFDNYVAVNLGRYIDIGLFYILIQIVILILLNPLRETIYIKDYEPWDTIVYSFTFLKENWIEWLIPNTIFTLVMFFSTKNIISILDIHFGKIIDFSLNGIFIFILGQIAFSFIMVYRGILFEELSTSTRRKRLYKRNMY